MKLKVGKYVENCSSNTWRVFEIDEKKDTVVYDIVSKTTGECYDKTKTVYSVLKQTATKNGWKYVCPIEEQFNKWLSST